MPIIVEAAGFMDLMGKLFGDITPSGMSIWPFVLVRDKATMSERTLRHELIHNKQQSELTIAAVIFGGLCMVVIALSPLPAWLVVGPLILMIPSALQGIVYGAFHWVGAIAFRGANSPLKRSYRSSPFELEAYANDDDPEYISHRRIFGWTGYVRDWRERIEKFEASAEDNEEE